MAQKKKHLRLDNSEAIRRHEEFVAEWGDDHAYGEPEQFVAVCGQHGKTQIFASKLSDVTCKRCMRPFADAIRIIQDAELTPEDMVNLHLRAMTQQATANFDTMETGLAEVGD